MKIHCPAHEDETPSCHVYPDGVYCFVCGYRGPIQDFGAIKAPLTKREPENVKATLKRILTLPKRTIRGLEFHAEHDGFYILWPNVPYYKKRFFGGRQRYLCPSGTRPPLFTYPGQGLEVIILVEGELNAASLKKAFPNTKATIASPGSCNDFKNYIPDLLLHKRIVAIMDKDPPGSGHGYEFRKLMEKRGKPVELITIEPDFNDLLQSGGVDAIQKEAKKQYLGL